MVPDDDLAAISRFAWTELERAARDRDSLFRHAQLATVDPHGLPRVRTVILRCADAARREIGFHTDRRSAKVAETGSTAAVALVAYDRARSLQIRLLGQAEAHTGDARAAEAWEGLYTPLRTPYRLDRAPGEPLDDPATGDPTPAMREPADRDAGFDNFAFVAVRVDQLEWLQLRQAGHRRARFEWNGRWDGSWLAP